MWIISYFLPVWLHIEHWSYGLNWSSHTVSVMHLPYYSIIILLEHHKKSFITTHTICTLNRSTKTIPSCSKKYSKIKYLCITLTQTSTLIWRLMSKYCQKWSSLYTQFLFWIRCMQGFFCSHNLSTPSQPWTCTQCRISF